MISGEHESFCDRVSLCVCVPSSQLPTSSVNFQCAQSSLDMLDQVWMCSIPGCSVPDHTSPVPDHVSKLLSHPPLESRVSAESEPHQVSRSLMVSVWGFASEIFSRGMVRPDLFGVSWVCLVCTAHAQLFSPKSANEHSTTHTHTSGALVGKKHSARAPSLPSHHSCCPKLSSQMTGGLLCWVDHPQS